MREGREEEELTEEQGRQKAKESGSRIDKLKARRRRKVCDKGKKKEGEGRAGESHQERR